MGPGGIAYSYSSARSMMIPKTTPDDVIKDLGGCGRYQIRISVIAHFMKTLICFSVMSTYFITVTPPWWCDDNDTENLTTNDAASTMVNSTDSVRGRESESVYRIFSQNVTSEDVNFKKCVTLQGNVCQKFRFEGRSTLVSEFNLVCDDAHIPSLLMSLHGAGALCGNLLSGQISDLFGRKRPFFAAIAITTTANFVSYLANTWTLMVVTSFSVGLASSSFMTTMYSLLSEFTLAQYRSWIIGFPSWSVQAAIYVGFAWLLQGWRYIQLANTIIGLPCLLAWWVIPDSFRWHLAHDNQETALGILRKVANVNKKPHVTMEQLQDLSLGETKQKSDRKYTILDILTSKKLTQVTFLMSFPWLAIGFVVTGVGFGVKDLSGSYYVNMILYSIVPIPSQFICIWFENRIGRKKTAALIYTVTALGGYAAGILHYIDTPRRGALVNGFALLAILGIQTAWGVVQTMTIELYPTVIRSIGFGTLAVLARTGSIIAPQLVFLSTKIPGIMFLVCGALSTISVLTVLGLDETRKANLADKIPEGRMKVQTDKDEDETVLGLDETRNANLADKIPDTRLEVQTNCYEAVTQTNLSDVTTSI